MYLKKIYDQPTQSYIRTAKLKVYKDGSWVDADTKYYKNSKWNSYSTSDNYIPNLSIMPNGIEYNWGYYHLKNESKCDKLREAYRRFWNAYLTAGMYNDVKYVYNGQEINQSSFINTYTFSGESYNALKVYLTDLELTANEAKLVFNSFEADSYSLIPKWCFCSSGEDTYFKAQIIANFLNGNKATYAYLPYHTKDEITTYKEYLKSSLEKINKKIKEFYDIDFIDRGYKNNNKYYSPIQKSRIAKCIHDWLVYHNVYGSDTTPLDGNQEIYPAMSDLITKPVCIGYAKAFNYCCWKWGITSVICYGTAGGNHAWNTYTCEPYTYYDSEIYDPSIWIDIDVTWGDNSNDLNYYIEWSCFNRTTEYLFQSRKHIRSYYGQTEYTDSSGNTVTATNGCYRSLPCSTSTNTSYTYYTGGAYSESDSKVYGGF